ncbi:MAG: 3'-5' exonuclease [Desulfobulbus sp.]|jgi:ribonuclease D
MSTAPRPAVAADLPKRIDKEAINLLPQARWTGPVCLPESSDEAEQAIKRLHRETLLGFDTETRPAFRRGQSFLPSLVQLAAPDEVVLFQLSRTGLPPGLLALLADPAVLKVGVALRNDLAGLCELAPFTPGGFVDLAPMARRKGLRNQGLRPLAALLLGVRISKSAQTSNWAAPELTPGQIDYAATDAWIGREIYQALQALPDPPRRRARN